MSSSSAERHNRARLVSVSALPQFVDSARKRRHSGPALAWPQYYSGVLLAESSSALSSVSPNK